MRPVDNMQSKELSITFFSLGDFIVVDWSRSHGTMCLFLNFQVLFYLLFIVIMVRIYSLPLFAVRPMYLTLRAFKKAFNDVIMSRRAIHNMNTWYPDATEEELANTDNVCIICR